jgi:hypothetical protein
MVSTYVSSAIYYIKTIVTRGNQSWTPPAVDAKCAAFLFMVNAVLEAGIGGPEGILLFDADGNLWKKQPDQMNPDDVAEYVEHKFGPVYAGFVREFWQFTLH